MKIMIFGYPGSGKTTQSKLLANKLGLKYVSVGDLTRKEVFQGTDFGKQIKEYLDREIYYPKGFLKNLISQELPPDNFIIDGYPKTEEELIDFKDILRIRNLKIDYLIILKNDYNSCKQRIEKRINCRYCGQPFSRGDIDKTSVCICGEKLFFRRKDESIFDFRCKDFENDTMKVVESLSQKIPTIDINGLGSVQDVYKKIKSGLNV